MKRADTTLQVSDAELVPADTTPTDNAEIEKIEIVIDLWSQGYRDNQVCKMLMAKYGVSRESGYRYLRDARPEIQKLSKASLEHNLSVAIARMDAVIKKATINQDLRTVVVASMHRDKLTGLVEGGPEKTQIDNPSEHHRRILRVILNDKKLKKMSADFLDQLNAIRTKGETEPA